MKITALLCALFVLQLNVFSQTESVEVIFNQPLVQQGDSLHFTIWSNTAEPLEVIVLNNDFLAMQQNVQAAFSTLPFHLSTEGFPPGKYFILVTGNGIHIEKEFSIWKPE